MIAAVLLAIAAGVVLALLSDATLVRRWFSMPEDRS